MTRRGYRIGKHEDKMGIRCVPVVEIHFDDCRVPAANLLGGKEGHGFKHAMITLDRARPAVAAQAVGLAQGAFDLAMEYTGEREQFGQIGQFVPGHPVDAGRHGDPDRSGASSGAYRGARAIDSRGEEHQQAVGDVQGHGVGCGHEGNDRLRAAVRRATATARTTPSRSTCATPRSRRSTRGRTRSSGW